MGYMIIMEKRTTIEVEEKTRQRLKKYVALKELKSQDEAIRQLLDKAKFE